MKFSKLAPFAAALALVAMLAGCSSKAGTYAQFLLDEARGIKVEAENASKDMEATTDGAFEVTADDVVIISPDVEKGSFHVTITKADDGTVVYDEDVDGHVLFPVTLDPGTYNVTTHGNNVTGWMTIFAQNAAEFAAENEALDEALATVQTEG